MCGFQEKNKMSPYVVLFAGEDSGDILGENVVSAICSLGLKSRGIGGKRMSEAGLESIENFEKFPVSGFFDVLPRLFFFKKILRLMKREISNPLCKAFIAIDYPGLNLKLVKFAKKCGKPVLYLSPPQIFAWKKKRANVLQGTKTLVFFPMEKESYEKESISAEKIKHPFVEAIENTEISEKENKIYLFPGSRCKVLRRNFELYAEMATKVSAIGQPIFVASRMSLKKELEKTLPRNIKVELSPVNAKDRIAFLSKAKFVIGNPGTALLESALCATPYAVFVKPDFLTYFMGKLFLKIKSLSLPNLLLKESYFPEIVIAPFTNKKQKIGDLYQMIEKLICQKEEIFLKREKLLEILNEGNSVQKSVTEFLLQFVCSKSH